MIRIFNKNVTDENELKMFIKEITSAIPEGNNVFIFLGEVNIASSVHGHAADFNIDIVKETEDKFIKRTGAL